MKDTIVMVFRYTLSGRELDIEVPKSITANDLICGLNEGLGLGIDVCDRRNAYLVAVNPRVLIRGMKSLDALGLRDGSIILYQGGL